MGRLLFTIPFSAARLGAMPNPVRVLLQETWNLATILLNISRVLPLWARLCRFLRKFVLGATKFVPLIMGLKTILVTLFGPRVNRVPMVLRLPQGVARALSAVVPGILGELGRLRAVIFDLVRIKNTLVRLRQ